MDAHALNQMSKVGVEAVRKRLLFKKKVPLLQKKKAG